MDFGMRLLVFDDDEATSRIVVKIAAALGYDTASVTTPEAFLGQLVTRVPDVIVLDLQLGSTDGIEQLRLLSKRQFHGWLVLITGFDTRVLASARGLAQSLGLKVRDVLAKPLRLEPLEAVLREVLATAEAVTPERILQGIKSDEFVLELQPIVRRHPRLLLKLEALIRWNHPVHGRLAPAAFLNVAEADLPTIDALTLWVVQAAAKAHHVLASQGLTVPLSMNISAHHLLDRTLPDRIENCLRAGGMPASSLCLEVTESAVFADLDVTLDILTRARLKGMSMAIDDFGTGHAGLRRLQQIPCSEVKIARALVVSAAQNADSRAIIKAIAERAADIGLSCVAEGVESDDVADVIERLGVSDLQGQGMSPPLKSDAVASWFAAWSSAKPAALPRERGHSSATAGFPETEVVASLLGRPMAMPARTHGDIKLPPRQLQVLRLLSEGKSVKEIARHLNLGPGTIKVHLSLAYSSLGARNRVEAVNRAAPLLQAEAGGAHSRLKLEKGTDC
jgi:EAL domain-containing protein (putative c-di-GMP-specific phosphodiesterase class I)/DNA-binding CsgD family transcriptional regulator/CheY-like chemotaxis protein